MQATHATQFMAATQNTVNTLVSTARLPAVAAEPATPTLPAVATEPATATLPAVATEPVTATLPAVATDPATAALSLVASEPVTGAPSTLFFTLTMKDVVHKARRNRQASAPPGEQGVGCSLCDQLGA
ncbi:MAG: hypothetical protein JOZ23_12970 [Mycobacterium sp.]|nr:hypothetical protein [Mycobacterium sp.]